MPTEIQVYEELAFADPSVAWIAMNSSAAGTMAARLKPESASELFAKPHSIYGLGLVSAGKAVATRGGFDVSGRWPVVSGCNAADWFLMASKLYDGRKLRRKNKLPVVRFAIVPASEAEPLETWSDVVAVRGSGSHAVSVAGSFVRRDMTASFDDRVRINRPYFKGGGMSLGSLGMAAVSLGIARYALESAVAQGTSRKSALSGTEWREWPSVPGFGCGLRRGDLLGAHGALRGDEGGLAVCRGRQEAACAASRADERAGGPLGTGRSRSGQPSVHRGERGRDPRGSRPGTGSARHARLRCAVGALPKEAVPGWRGDAGGRNQRSDLLVFDRSSARSPTRPNISDWRRGSAARLRVDDRLPRT